MLKILQAWLQQYVNQELPDVQATFLKSSRTRDQIANICWIMGTARKFQKNICLFDYIKFFVWITANWKILRGGNNRPPFLSPEKPVYAGQEAAVRTGHGTLTGSKLRKETDKAVYCHLLI